MLAGLIDSQLRPGQP